MIRTIAAVLASGVLLGGCSLVSLGGGDAATTAAPQPAKEQKACEAMRESFPLTFAWPGDTAETVHQVRQANARFASACP